MVTRPTDADKRLLLLVQMQASVGMLLCCLLGAATLIATMHAATLLPRQVRHTDTHPHTSWS